MDKLAETGIFIGVWQNLATLLKKYGNIPMFTSIFSKIDHDYVLMNRSI